MRFSFFRGAGCLSTALLLASSSLINAQTFIRCNAAQQQILVDAWDDAIALANSAYAVMNGKSNEALVRKYFFAVSTADRTMIETAFLNVATSATIKNSFVLACGDFQLNDQSTSGVPVPATINDCANPLTNAYTRKVSYPGDVLGTATNDIAFCAMMAANRIGRIQTVISGPFQQYVDFCGQNDIPGLNPADNGFARRTYFRGWTFLHELMHTASIAGHIVAQGPGDKIPYPGTADFTYDQASAGILEPDQAARNADSYAHFAWEAFFEQVCFQAPRSAPREFNPDDYVDWDAMEAALTKKKKRDAANISLGVANDIDLPSVAAVKRRAEIPKKVPTTADTGSKKPRTRPRKGKARIIKLLKCPGCHVELKGPKKALKKLDPPKRTEIKKCPAKQIFIPQAWVNTKVNPNLKSGTCMPIPTKAGTTTTTPPGQGPKTGPTVKAPTVKQPGTSTPTKKTTKKARRRRVRGLSSRGNTRKERG